MRVLIYSQSVLATALAGALSAMGHRIEMRNPRYWRGEIEPCDFLVVGGMRAGRRIVTAYDQPALVVDWGYLHRVNSRDEVLSGHWQVGIGNLNRLPPFACPTDRFDSLGLEIAAKGGDAEGYILLIGQMPGDAAHAGVNHEAWLKEQVERYGADNILYRPHPRGGVELSGVERDTGSLSEALEGARLVVTYNSNAGHEALMAGVPVVCDLSAAYAELSGEQLPSLDDRRAYFARVAYGQWLASEAEQCSAFILDHLLTGNGFEGVGDASEPKGDSEPSRRDFLLDEIERLSGKRPGSRSKEATLEQRYAELSKAEHGGDE